MARARPPRSASSPSIWRMPALRCCWGGPAPFPLRRGSSWGAGAPATWWRSAGRGGGKDVVVVDPAGRLPTQLHLMQELAKIRRVIGKADAGAPHEVLLVLDGNTGQNA